jgi:membrane-associated phospholipid phosphatase
MSHIVMGIVVIPLLLMFNKYESLVYVNQHHSPFLDLLMYHLTRIPELASIVFIIILGLFAERRQFFAIVMALSLSGILIVLSKNFIFSDFKRPFAWIMQNPPFSFHFVEGIKLHSNGSFPSGHTISAFCSLSLIGFLSRSGWIQFFLILFGFVNGVFKNLYTSTLFNGCICRCIGGLCTCLLSILFYAKKIQNALLAISSYQT